MGAVWANRAQCWLKMGDHEKARLRVYTGAVLLSFRTAASDQACADAEKCTEALVKCFYELFSAFHRCPSEVEPTNPKGWFRKGISQTLGPVIGTLQRAFASLCPQASMQCNATLKLFPLSLRSREGCTVFHGFQALYDYEVFNLPGLRSPVLAIQRASVVVLN